MEDEFPAAALVWPEGRIKDSSSFETILDQAFTPLFVDISILNKFSHLQIMSRRVIKKHDQYSRNMKTWAEQIWKQHFKSLSDRSYLPSLS